MSGEVTMSPDTEELLRKVIADPNKLNYYTRTKLLGQLNHLIALQTKKLVTLSNLRDAIERQQR